jgi:hypothetical protein
MNMTNATQDPKPAGTSSTGRAIAQSEAAASTVRTITSVAASLRSE